MIVEYEDKQNGDVVFRLQGSRKCYCVEKPKTDADWLYFMKGMVMMASLLGNSLDEVKEIE